ncbi:FAD-dependent oxidoreductase [Natronococcus sp. A-GB1]|uniref:FAD-dependent oxidoreductase n=1 Tax=Natronococcus sp. A-GB1 TaxID=3037648 RepID=UPI00241E6DDA|nr:FAD-dependent oxidoreductase [Natronococcus sp. A-GB1]MDG5761794.1 FAD-dependent oxidoreductase [Natronococcus sp. A-GB1]
MNSNTRHNTDRTEPDENSPQEYDVVIVGSGPAGAAAALFCARAELETLLVANGRSTLQKCAYVENYLGFPAGIEPQSLLDLARAHVEQTDCTVRTETVDGVTQQDDTLVVDCDGEAVTTEELLAASWSKSEYLDGLGVEKEQEEDGPVDEIVTDEDGRTNVPGVWAAGRITGTHHQALVNAGDGARVALNLIETFRPSYYNDWVVPDGYYASFDREIPTGVEEIDHEERQRRANAGQKWMREFF